MHWSCTIYVPEVNSAQCFNNDRLGLGVLIMPFCFMKYIFCCECMSIKESVSSCGWQFCSSKQESCLEAGISTWCKRRCDFEREMENCYRENSDIVLLYVNMCVSINLVYLVKFGFRSPSSIQGKQSSKLTWGPALLPLDRRIFWLN